MKCRSGTLLKTARPQNHCVGNVCTMLFGDGEYVILGFYERIGELNKALLEEEHHEEEILKQQQLEC